MTTDGGRSVRSCGFPLRGDRPQPERAVDAARQQGMAVGGEGDRADRSLEPLITMDLAPGGEIPQADGLIDAPRGCEAAIRGRDDPEQMPTVAPQHPPGTAGFEIPEERHGVVPVGGCREKTAPDPGGMTRHPKARHAPAMTSSGYPDAASQKTMGPEVVPVATSRPSDETATTVSGSL